MEIKLIAADVDGTLINEAKELSPATEAAIRAAQARGLLFTLATGREIAGIRRFRHLLSPGVPLITCNGAELRDADSGRLLQGRFLKEAAAAQVIAAGLEKGYSVIVWCGGELYIGAAGLYTAGYAQQYDREELPLEDPSQLCRRGVTKIIWCGPAPEIAAWEQRLREAPIPQTVCCTSEVTYLEFMAEAVDKGSGLQAAASLLGLSRENVMAVGDGHNDLTMLRWAGFGVAMGNGSAEVRAAADAVTASCEADGLAQAIDRLLEDMAP